MSLLYRIVYAAHAKGTHHKLALDALSHLGGDQGDAWQRMFLKYAPIYLQGSKAPDDEFKDFKNHVLHVRDDFWGGAPEKARRWYGHLVEALQCQDWVTATYCAGVLSHYVTDPIQPLHTAQSEAENNIHRAVEWSIAKAYDDLKLLAARELPKPTIEVAEGTNWLERLICESAVEANRHYEKLIAHYDINRGVVDPPAGLDVVARRIVAGLIAKAVAVYGSVLQRAIQEAGVAPPQVSLSLETVLATLQVPVKWITNRLADREEQRLVQRMYDELRATGTVEANLPEDDRMVRDQHVAEVLAKRARSDGAAKFPFRPAEKVETTVERSRRRAATVAAMPEPAHDEPEAAVSPGDAPAAAARVARAIDKLAGARAAAPSPIVHLVTSNASEQAVQPSARFYLTGEHDVVDAPSIGPKTAARLNAVGIDTVDDLLKAHPIALAARLNDRHITEETIADWQDQARLVCTVPGLRGTGAQLLVGAGYRTDAAISDANADKLCADVLAFAATGGGQRILRDGNPPDLARIRSWVESARRAKAA